MTKSSIQISGNYPINQSQNIYNLSKIESMELNIEGKNPSKELKMTNNAKKIQKNLVVPTKCSNFAAFFDDKIGNNKNN